MLVYVLRVFTGSEEERIAVRNASLMLDTVGIGGHVPEKYSEVTLFCIVWIFLGSSQSKDSITEPPHDKTNEMTVRPAKTQSDRRLR